ncbi:hypothetical protein ACYX7E_10020 [Luteimonas sp. RIT-PG2_3]
MSPTARSLAALRKDGWHPWVVETYSSFTRKRYDLYGFIDILAIKGSETLAVQATSYSNVSSRVNKIADHENVGRVREAGWRIEVWGWHKVGNRWQCRVVDCS